VGPNDEVLTSDLTLAPSISGAIRLGAKPVFIDIDPLTYTIDPSALWYYLEGNPRPKALVVVHLYGQSANMDLICDICDHFNVAVIEDCAQSLGAVYPSRKGTYKVGKAGKLSCFSFFPTKPLGGMGDGGAIATDDAELAEKLRALRNHGWESGKKYDNQIVGINSRLDAIQAAILRVKLPHLDYRIKQVQDMAAVYDDQLNGVHTPQVPFGRTSHSYHLYTIATSCRRNEIRDALTQAGIETGIYFPLPMHRQFAFQHYKANAPKASRACSGMLNLPIFPGLTEEDQTYVIERVNANA
jgi:dTDP-4-amino-4,6-dideoxygalactose transaminase